MNESPSFADAASGVEPLGRISLELGEPGSASRLRLPARQTGVALVRQFVTGVAQTLCAFPHAAEDMKLAVTEAASNVVKHAYPDVRGDLTVEVEAIGEDVFITVRDDGIGPPDGDRPGGPDAGYGLSLIESVTDESTVGAVTNGGTEVWMAFRGALVPEAVHEDALHSPVLRRVVALAASQAGFDLDRLSDAVLVADMVAAHSGAHSSDGVVRISLDDGGREIALAIEQLAPGGGEAILLSSRLPGFGPVLERLADAVEVERESAGEQLVVRLGRRA